MTYLTDAQIRAAVEAAMRRHPAGRKQRYRLTPKGHRWLENAKAAAAMLFLLALVGFAGWIEGL